MKKIMPLILCIAILLPVCGCGAKRMYTYTSFEFFDTVTVIYGYAGSREEFNKTADMLKEQLSWYHRLFDIYNEYDGLNNLMTVNKNAGQTPVEVDGPITELLSFALEMCRLTDGAVNPAMGSVTSVWNARFTAAASGDPVSLPDDGELRAAAGHISPDSVIIDNERQTVFITDPLTQIDVGAFAKGYVAEKLAALLEFKGISGYVLNIGGNLRTVGQKADGSPFTAGIRDPFSEENYKGISIRLEDSSLVTSGVYQRNFTVGGKTYHHIIDPDTLYPKDEFSSVSVWCRDSATADALSTAVFNMDYEEGKRFVEKTDGVEALWIFPDGEYGCTVGFEYEIMR